MYSNGHMKKTFTFFSLLTLRKEEHMWNSSLRTILHTSHNWKWQIMEEVKSIFIQASTHINLNHPKLKFGQLAQSGITLLGQHTAIFRDISASLLKKLYLAEEKHK